MAKKTKEEIEATKNWLPDSNCPIVPASGYYAVDMVGEPQVGLVLDPSNHNRAMPGGVAVVRICAVTPKGDVLDAIGFVTSGLYRPGDIVYAQLSIDLKGEAIEYQDPKTRKTSTFYCIPEGRIIGRHRQPEKFLANFEEKVNA